MPGQALSVLAADRDIQIESLWGNLLLVADRLGYDAMVREAFGSYDITTGITATVKTLSTVLSLLVIGSSGWLDAPVGKAIRGIWRRRSSRRWPCCPSPGESCHRSTSSGSWPLPRAAVAVAAHVVKRRSMALLLIAILLTHVGFPLLAGEPVSLAVLTARNLCLMTLAFCAVRAWLAMSGAQSAGGSVKREPPVAMA
jgi:hypothetical protein